METTKKFIVIDEDNINNRICRMAIERVAPQSEIQTFYNAEEGFAYILKQDPDAGKPTFLFLDINMPVWSDWDFLDHFEMLDIKLKKQFLIYMLSSSVDPNDRKRASENKNVTGFIEKPLSKETLIKILG